MSAERTLKWLGISAIVLTVQLLFQCQSTVGLNSCKTSSRYGGLSRQLDGLVFDATSDVCGVDIPAGRGGAVIGVLLPLHDAFDAFRSICPKKGLHQRTAAEQTESVLVGWHLSAEKNRVDIEDRLTAFGFRDATSLFGLRLRDTCSSEELGLEHALEMSFNATISELQPRLYSGKSDSTACEPHVLAVVGPGSDLETARLSPVLSAFQLPHVSYLASAHAFDDVSTYPYLFRMFPSHFDHMRAIGKIIRTFGWRYIAAFASKETLYGEPGLIGLQYQATEVDGENFCFGLIDMFSLTDVTPPNYSTNLLVSLEKLRQDTSIKVVVVLALAKHTDLFLNLLFNLGITDRIVIASADWLSQMDASVYHRTSNKPPFVSLLGVMPRLYANSSWVNQVKNNLKLKKIIGGNRLEENPFLHAFSANRFNCLLENSSKVCPQLLWNDSAINRTCDQKDIERSQAQDTRASLLTESILLTMDTVLQAIVQAWKTHNSSVCDYPTGKEIACALENLQQPCWDSGDGQCKIFNKYHAADATYDVVNLQWTEDGHGTLRRIALYVEPAGLIPFDGAIVWNLRDSKEVSVYDTAAVPQSNCTPTCNPGQYAKVVKDPLLRCCKTCQNCSKYEFSNETNAKSCDPCPRGSLPDEEHKSCVGIELTYLTWEDGSIVSTMLLASIGVLVTLYTIAVFWINRKVHIIRCADIHLSPIILVAMLIGFLSTPLILAKPSNAQCIGREFAATVAPLFATSGLFVKLHRVARILNTSSLSQQLSKWWKFAMGTPVQLVCIVLITFLGELIIIIGVIADPPQAKHVLVGLEKVELVCEWSSSWQAVFLSYCVVLVLSVTCIAFQTRKLPDNYNEARLVFMASFTSCVVWMGMAPAYFLNDGVLRPAILAIMVNAQMWGLWFCLFLRRLYDLYLSRKQPNMELCRTRLTSVKTLNSVPRGSINMDVLGDNTTKNHGFRKGARAVSDSAVGVTLQYKAKNKASAAIDDSLHSATLGKLSHSSESLCIGESGCDSSAAATAAEAKIND